MVDVVIQEQNLQVVKAAPLQAGKRVRSVEELHALMTLVASNAALGAFVDTLDIALFSPVPAHTLRNSIALLPNLTDLVLIIPRLRSPAALLGVHLPLLQYFRTDLPHGMLLGFLQAHPTITDLDLLEGAHGNKPCPLLDVVLCGVKCFSGPARCVSQLAQPGTTRLTLELEADSYGASLSIRAVNPPLSFLYQLIVDIRDDDDILSSIASAFPTLRKLKLIEKPSKMHRRSLSRRAWNDALSWHKGLRKLPQLEELLLRTAAPLVRKVADLNAERKVITTWVHGSRRASIKHPNKAHPMLYHVGVWYGARLHGGGCITHWSQLAWGWDRTISVVGPERDQIFC